MKVIIKLKVEYRDNITTCTTNYFKIRDDNI